MVLFFQVVFSVLAISQVSLASDSSHAVDLTTLELICEGIDGRRRSFEVRKSVETEQLYFFEKGGATPYLEFIQDPDGSISASNYITVFASKTFAFDGWTYERFSCRSPD